MIRIFFFIRVCVTTRIVSIPPSQHVEKNCLFSLEISTDRVSPWCNYKPLKFFTSLCKLKPIESGSIRVFFSLSRSAFRRMRKGVFHLLKIRRKIRERGRIFHGRVQYNPFLLWSFSSSSSSSSSSLVKWEKQKIPLYKQNVSSLTLVLVRCREIERERPPV